MKLSTESSAPLEHVNGLVSPVELQKLPDGHDVHADGTGKGIERLGKWGKK